MANGNTNIGVRPTTPVTTDFGGIVQQGVQGILQQREKQRLEQERQDQKRQEFEDRYGIEEDLYVLPDTEFRTVNDATTEALSQYRDRYYDVYKALQRNPNDIELKKRLGNITNSVKRMRASHEKFVELGDQGLQMIAEDRMSGVDEDRWREQVQGYDEGKFAIRLDEQDNMQFLFYDNNGSLAQVVPYNEFAREGIYSKVDVQEEVNGMLKMIGRDRFDEVTGRFIETVDRWGARQDLQARTLVRQQLVSDEVIADLLNQATNGTSKKRTDFTDREVQLVEDYMVNSIRNAYSEANTLRERPFPPQRRPRTGSGGQGDPISTDLIQPATADGQPSISDDGRFRFTIAQPIAVDPTKSDRKIDVIEATADGNIIFRGEDREKIKGIQDSENKSEEDVAAESGLNADDIIRLLDGDGKVTFYRRVPFVEDANTVINKVGNMFGVNDEDGLRNVLYQKFVEKFGQQQADRFFGGDLTPSTSPQPTAGMTPEEKLEFYSNLGQSN